MNGDYQEVEKIGLFDAVVKKVGKRYGEGASKLNGVMTQWWLGVRDEVQKEVRKESGKVEELAANAQADLGVDYASLEGVTTHDWTRYHELKRTAAMYVKQYQAIIDGEHAQSPVDPLPDAIWKLQAELSEIVPSFETNLAKVRDDRLSMFIGRPPKDTTPEDCSDQLPVTGVPGARIPEESGDPRILGRGKEEIFSALSRASPMEATEQTESNGSVGENERISCEP